MISIWKFSLEVADVQKIEMPEGADLLCIQVQDGVPCLWAKVETSADKEPRTFRTFGTGHHILYGDSDNLQYIGTYQLRGGGLVLHVFEEPTHA